MANEINGNGSKLTYKQKLHEPILNPIQITVLLVIIVFEVVANILPILMGLDINPYWVLATMIVGIVSFAILTMLRAAYPEQMPDTRITTAFQVFIKQIIDALFENKEETSDLKTLLERIMVWSVREWDIIYQKDLDEAIKYAKVKLIEQELEELETVPESNGTTDTESYHTT